MGSPHDKRACRRLFDDGEDRGTRRQLDRLQEDSSRAWNFDFARDRPMHGRYQWQRDDDNARTQRRWGDASPGSDSHKQKDKSCSFKGRCDEVLGRSEITGRTPY
ncbi:cyclin-dependent kinase inhibitor 1-like [Haemaphysalis longicornis]